MINVVFTRPQATAHRYPPNDIDAEMELGT